MAQIAWIEDDHQRIDALVSLLRRANHTILCFSSWEHVTAEMETICKSDVVILDIILPSATEDDVYLGLAILAKLRKQQRYRKPVIVCSRVRNPDVLKQLQKLRVTEILTKPVRPSVLYDVVSKALNHA